MHGYTKGSPRILFAGAVWVFAVIGSITGLARADDADDPRPAAVSAMQTWLAEVDQHQFARSWTDASRSFQKAITSDQWIAALSKARTPLGKCISRKLASSVHQTEVPSPAGVQNGDFVVAQFDSSFENLAYAVETVCFEKAPGGAWKAAGYYVRPRA